MPFNQKPQKFNAKINAVTIGSGDKTVTIGGDCTFPFYSFDAESENCPKIGVEISDMGLEGVSEGIKAYYEGATTMADIAKKAAAMEGADFVALILEGGDPNGVNKSIDELIAVVKEVADAVDCPLVVEGCKNVEKDAELLPKVAEALQGRNALILSEKEENYKAIGAAAGLAYNQIVGAESAVDINLAKQLNVVTTQLGVDAKKIVMNIGSAAVGYGYEYVVSTMDRIKGAALGQNDNMLQMPIITPVSSETWGVKESVATEEDILNMVRKHGLTPNEHTASVSHVQLNPSATAVMMRLGVKDCPVFGALGCIDLDTKKTHMIADKPVHQLWFDDDTYMATRQFNQGRHIEMETSYIARFSKDGEELEVLGGISNHMDGSFDRKYFAGDRCYPDFAPNVYLYKRGDKNPIATFEISQDEYTTWKLQVHPNPSFSRDGKRLYFNKQCKCYNGTYRTVAVFADVSEII